LATTSGQKLSVFAGEGKNFPLKDDEERNGLEELYWQYIAQKYSH
jgi:hypothetical protein